MVLLVILCLNLKEELQYLLLWLVLVFIFYIATGLIVSVVMAVLLAVAVVFIVALLAIVLKQRKQIQRLAVVPPPHVTCAAQSIYEDVTDITKGQSIELTENIVYGKFNN